MSLSRNFPLKGLIYLGNNFDSFGYYPINYLLLNLNMEEEESEKLWDEVLFNTEMELKKIYHLQAITNPTQYIFDFLN